MNRLKIQAEKWILSIGTGVSQQPLIEAAKKRCLRVLGVDICPNYNLVDKALPISTYEAHQVTKAVSALKDKMNFVAIISRTSGPAVFTVANAAHCLKLPSINFDFANISVSKSELRLAAKRRNVPTFDEVDVEPFIKHMKPLDVVVKPDQPIFGKKNVFHVKNHDQYLYAKAKAAGESVNGKIECLKFCGGRDITIVMAYSNGKCLWEFVFEEIVVKTEGRFLGQRVTTPVKKINKKTRDLLSFYSNRFLAGWVLTGHIFLTFRLSDNSKLRLYEVNSGLGGDGIVEKLFSSLWPSFDFFDIELQLSLGMKPEFPSNDYVETG